jgi:hypothetical protein
LVDGLGMGDEKQGSVGVSIGEAKDPPSPDIQPVFLRVGGEVERTMGDGMDPRCGIDLSPAVVVLPDGKQQGLSPRMFGKIVGPPEGQQVTGKSSVIGLRDDPQLISFIDNDHGVIKNSGLEDRVYAFSFS